MHPTLSYHLAQARMADLRHHAQRAALARAARRTRHGPRELDVLMLVAQELANPGIARHLAVSEHTMHRHLANILRKLSPSSRVAARLGRAYRAGLSPARSGHLPRLCESGPHGRSDSATPPDITYTTGNGFTGDCRRAGEAVNRAA
jgi:DNA-binding CsgD family transcriptional regulator